MSVNSTNPSTFFGGSWAQIKDTFLLACGNTYGNGATGGEATHKLTTGELPAHTHGSKALTGSVWNFAVQSSGTGVSANGIFKAGNSNSGNVGYATSSKTGSGTSYTDVFDITATHEHSSVGNNTAHNNMPPYLAVYVWKRTA